MSDFDPNREVADFYDNCLYEFLTEFRNDLKNGETLDDIYDRLSDECHERADGLGWVIYTYRAARVCAEFMSDESANYLFKEYGSEGLDMSQTMTRFAYCVALSNAQAALREAYEEASHIVDEDHDEEDN